MRTARSRPPCIRWRAECVPGGLEGCAVPRWFRCHKEVKRCGQSEFGRLARRIKARQRHYRISTQFRPHDQSQMASRNSGCLRRRHISMRRTWGEADSSCKPRMQREWVLRRCGISMLQCKATSNVGDQDEENHPERCSHRGARFAGLFAGNPDADPAAGLFQPADSAGPLRPAARLRATAATRRNRPTPPASWWKGAASSVRIRIRMSGLSCGVTRSPTTDRGVPKLASPASCRALRFC